MTLSEKQRRFTKMTAALIEWAYANGYELTFGHAWRDSETQRRLVEMKLSKTMNSKHCERLAVDFNLWRGGKYITDSAAYKPLGDFWKSIGGRWGGDFTGFQDGNHFEYGD